MDPVQIIVKEYEQGKITVEQAKTELNSLVDKGEIWPGFAAAIRIELERGRTNERAGC